MKATANYWNTSNSFFLYKSSKYIRGIIKKCFKFPVVVPHLYNIWKYLCLKKCDIKEGTDLSVL